MMGEWRSRPKTPSPYVFLITHLLGLSCPGAMAYHKGLFKKGNKPQPCWTSLQHQQ